MSTAADKLTLQSLAPRSYWVAWQQEDRPNGEPTKVPYSPDGRKAEADTPSTWGPRLAAERRAALLPKPYGMGGVGIELTGLDPGLNLGGFDWDTCRDPQTGEMEGWAEDLIASADTYSEVSPSGTGAKGFFTYDAGALPELRKHMGTATWSKTFSRGGGKHPPAIELHLGHRYFAVTDDLLPGARSDLRHLDAGFIRAILQTYGPAFMGNGAERGKHHEAPGIDRSRSASAFRVGSRAVRNGASFEQMCAALRSDTETAEWMASKGEANSCREAKRIYEKAKENGPIVRVVAGDLDNTATAGEAAMIAASVPIYQRGNGLVRPVVQEVPAARGRMTITAALYEIGTHALVDALCECARWERYDERAKDWLRINPPKQVAETILSRAGRWALPKVIGVVTCPTLRPDGSVLTAGGYDATTHLYHAADASLRLHPAVHAPTEASARSALTALENLLAEFPFADRNKAGVSKAVALSALITPVVRGAMTVAPLHAFRANTAGSGKSYLVDTASAIATGRQCPVASAAADEAETEKRIAGLLLGGFPIASLDNVNGELGGDLLCQAIERPLIRIRRLGASDIVEIESRATLFATGNALRVRGDMTRRTLLCDLDANMERPELRKFDGDPVATVMADRGRYVSACLVIVRAYIQAGSPGTLPPVASFSDWSRLVRSALVWLGCADPAASMESAREDDPELAELTEAVAIWSASLPLGEGHTVKELVDAAEEKQPTKIGEPSDYARPQWRDFLIRLAGERGTINTKKVSNWVRKYEGRIVAGHRIRRTDQASGGIWRWALHRA